MKNYDIIEFRKSKPSKIEPTRTRPYIRFTCFHCKSTVEEAKSSFKEDKPCTVYFVHFEDVNLFKCGVTYKSVHKRFIHLKNTSITPIWTLNFDTLFNAYFFEYQFFREYAKYRTSHPDTMMGGYTEFLSIGIPKPSKRFIEEILCRKESNSEKLPPQSCEDNSERSPYTGTCND